MKWNTRLVFPSIILATFSGAGAVGSEQLLPFSGATTLVGVVSLFVGVLQTIQNYFDFAKNAEAHRIAALQYNKMQSQLSMQLSLPRSERKPAEEIIEWISNERDRLAEIVPILPQIIKDQFKKEFANLESFALPSNLNGLKCVTVVDEVAEKKSTEILFFPTTSTAAQIAKSMTTKSTTPKNASTLTMALATSAPSAPSASSASSATSAPSPTSGASGASGLSGTSGASSSGASGATAASGTTIRLDAVRPPIHTHTPRATPNAGAHL